MVLNDHVIAAPRFLLNALPQAPERHTGAVLVVGGGAAGLAAALRAAEGAEVTLLARGPLLESNSAWAQGGIAAALDRDDSPRFHVADTLVAGAGLSDPAAVEALAWEAPALMRELAALGAPFERAERDFALGLEGGHSHRRIVHVGDATGLAVVRVLVAQARAHPRIRILEGWQAVDLLGGPGYCSGLLACDEAGRWHQFSAAATILATGGAGALYGLTSNLPTALGEGIALAYRAGAEVADMEFVQFHPTVFRTCDRQGFLISEAARGEGGRLLTPDGARFMPAFDPRAELAPRDVVTRGIFDAMQRSGSDYVLLDLTHLVPDFLERRFPTILARCRAEGVDPTQTPIPVAPAAHYLMGGIRTDLDGATSLAGLYAAGECACTGVHGANRLASNSLLECLVFGRRAGRQALEAGAGGMGRAGWRGPVGTGRAVPAALPAPSLAALHAIMRENVGPVRTGASLTAALQQLDQFDAAIYTRLAAPSPQLVTLANAALTARLIAAGALLRTESRGGHFRADYPQADPNWQAHIVQARGQATYAVATVAVTGRELVAAAD